MAASARRAWRARPARPACHDRRYRQRQQPGHDERGIQAPARHQVARQNRTDGLAGALHRRIGTEPRAAPVRRRQVREAGRRHRSKDRRCAPVQDAERDEDAEAGNGKVGERKGGKDEGARHQQRPPSENVGQGACRQLDEHAGQRRSADDDTDERRIRPQVARQQRQEGRAADGVAGIRKKPRHAQPHESAPGLAHERSSPRL